MVIDESSRHAMFTRLQEVLGNKHARVLMEHLPPVGWADVATKHDLEALRISLSKDIKADLKAQGTELRKELVATRSELEASLQRELRAVTRTFVTWLLAGMGTSTAAAVAALVVAARGLS